MLMNWKKVESCDLDPYLALQDPVVLTVGLRNFLEILTIVSENIQKFWDNKTSCPNQMCEQLSSQLHSPDLFSTEKFGKSI